MTPGSTSLRALAWISSAGRVASAAFALAAALAGAAVAKKAAVAIPAPAIESTSEQSTATAIFAGGCFWGVQGVFQHVNGVTGAVSGYAGGSGDTATYAQTSTGRTGHAEAVEVTYDPGVVSYADLLHVFFSVVHNPTQLNRQGPDRGPQYRSAVFPAGKEQAQAARAYIEQLDEAGVFEGPIVTTIEEAATFYPAEAYHQDYLSLHPDEPYIVTHDLPKVEALRRLFPEAFRAEPVLVGAS